MNVREWVVWTIAFMLAAGVPAASRQQAANSAQQPSFRSGVTAVPIDVRVIDKDGRPIANLKKEDFTILEDGVLQPITFFLPQVLAAETPSPDLRARPDAQPFDSTPQNHRVFLIVLGTRALGDTQRHPETLNGLIQFVRERLLPQDHVALLAYNRATDFTTDHEKIVRLLETFRGSEAGATMALARQGNLAAAGAGSVFAPPEALDTSPALQTELGFEDYVNARGGQPLGELDSLFYGIKYLRYMGGEKHLIFVTELGPEPTWDQVKYLTSLAADARVALDTIQIGVRAGGMKIPAETFPSPPVSPAAPGAQAPVYQAPNRPAGGGEARGAAGGGRAGGAGGGAVAIEGGPTGEATFSSPIPGFKGLYDLRYIAAQTGGEASISKDAALALDRIDTDTRVRYLLAYYPSNGDWNGRYRSVKVEVDIPGATVFFRHGYYARRDADVFDRRRVISNSRIEAAGYQLNDIRGINLSFVPSFTRGETGRGGEVLVPLSIDVSRLAWSRDPDGRHLAKLEIAVYCGDGGGKIIGETRRLLNLALTDATYDRVMKERFSREMRVAVSSTPQTVKVIVYDYDADLVGSALVKIRR